MTLKQRADNNDSGTRTAGVVALGVIYYIVIALIKTKYIGVAFNALCNDKMHVWLRQETNK